MSKPAEASALTYGLVMAFFGGVAGGSAAYQGSAGPLDALLLCAGFALFGFIVGYLRIYF